MQCYHIHQQVASVVMRECGGDERVRSRRHRLAGNGEVITHEVIIEWSEAPKAVHGAINADETTHDYRFLSARHRNEASLARRTD